MFGVSASPFLLNATLDHHIAKFESVDRQFVHKFRRSVYVDDLASGAQDIDGAYEFYIKSKLRLAEASFNLRKFDSNSPELRQRIAENEQSLCQDPSTTKPQSHVDDPHTEAVERQVLGVRWNVTADHFIFDVSDIYRLMKDTKPMKRNAVSLATRFFDPLGVISPITVRFKLLFQQLCKSKTSWDEPLTGALLAEWESLSTDLEQSEPIVIPRYLDTVLELTAVLSKVTYYKDFVMPPRGPMQPSYICEWRLKSLFTLTFVRRPELHLSRESLFHG